MFGDDNPGVEVVADLREKRPRRCSHRHDRPLATQRHFHPVTRLRIKDTIEQNATPFTACRLPQIALAIDHRAQYLHAQQPHHQPLRLGPDLCGGGAVQVGKYLQPLGRRFNIPRRELPLAMQQVGGCQSTAHNYPFVFQLLQMQQQRRNQREINPKRLASVSRDRGFSLNSSTIRRC